MKHAVPLPSTALKKTFYQFLLAIMLTTQGWITLAQTVHQHFLNKSFDLANLARQHGNHPFGALLVYKNKVILTAENKVLTSHDVTAHAEMVLLRKASKTIPKHILEKSILYSSTEPCPMCAGAIYWSGVSEVVFGCSVERLAKITQGGLVLPSKDIFKAGERPIKVTGPLFEKQAAQVHKGFWTH